MCVYVYVRIVSVQTPESSSSSMDSTCLTALPTETLGTLALEGSHQVPTGAAIVTRQRQTLVDVCGGGGAESCMTITKKGACTPAKKNNFWEPLQKSDKVHHLLLLLAPLFTLCDVRKGCHIIHHLVATHHQPGVGPLL